MSASLAGTYQEHCWMKSPSCNATAAQNHPLVIPEAPKALSGTGQHALLVRRPGRRHAPIRANAGSPHLSPGSASRLSGRRVQRPTRPGSPLRFGRDDKEGPWSNAVIPANRSTLSSRKRRQALSGTALELRAVGALHDEDDVGPCHLVIPDLIRDRRRRSPRRADWRTPARPWASASACGNRRIR